MRLNVGCGQDILTGDWINIDKHPMQEHVIAYDVDEHDPALDSWNDQSFDEVRCYGCLNEFKTDVVEMLSEFWRVLRHGGICDIKVAVIDNGQGAFRDPLARRYLHSQWADYFAGDDEGRLNGGKGLGFTGAFKLLENTVAGETHHVILEAVREQVDE